MKNRIGLIVIIVLLAAAFFLNPKYSKHLAKLGVPTFSNQGARGFNEEAVAGMLVGAIDRRLSDASFPIKKRCAGLTTFCRPQSTQPVATRGGVRTPPSVRRGPSLQQMASPTRST